MKPYYSESGVTLYHGDCREVLPTLDANSVDLLLTDPPYQKIRGGMSYNLAGGVGRRDTPSLTIGDPWDANLQWAADAWRIARLGAMVFCGGKDVPEVALAFPEESRVTLATWYTRNSPPAIANVPRFTTQYIWMFRKTPGLKWNNFGSTMFDVPLLQSGCMATERILRDGKSAHPTQKPLSLMQRLLCADGESVLDPFAGSGTTLLAAKNLGRKAVGVEIDEAYCDLVARRLSQEVLPLGEIPSEAS